ncbi:tolloid-like protein 2 isoform X2 [Montipora capricornis]|uniref:tolloid-like protein 2 isoform X2 n=1 Tax=Montipora capricornis TaxID=246305 RepID=UPI0035F17966
MISSLFFIAFFFLLAQSVESTPCDTTLNGSASGIISSLNFPGIVGASSTCTWTISVPSGRIKVTFHNFSLETNEKTNCVSAQGARLTITNVASDDGRNPFQLCGQTIPHPVYSIGREITMTLQTASNEVAGFNASYETITDETLCPSTGSLTDVSGEITSPFYPRNYPSRQNCAWNIQARKGQHVKLNVTEMDIQQCGQGDACTCDYLEVQDAFDGATRLASGRTCSSQGFKQLTYYSIHETLNVRFFSDLDPAKRQKGFKAIYSILSSKPPDCPSFPIPLSGEGAGSISSPSYPDNYIPEKNCYWLINATAGNSVKVTIIDFAMGNCVDCSSDICSRVEFYDGPSSDSRSLGRFCTGSPRTATVSSGTQMFVHFYSGFSRDRGFKAEYMETVPPTAGAAVASTTSLLVLLSSSAATFLWN